MFKTLPDDITYPFIVNMLTSLTLFIVALTFAPIRNFLFAKPEISEYPLFCTAEPEVKDSGNGELVVEFFIINRTEEEWTRQELIDLLQRYNPNPSSPLLPDIELKYNRLVNGNPVGKIGQIDREQDFNQDKGNISVANDSNTVKLSVNNIKPRAIMKISIPIINLPSPIPPITRMTKASIPLEFDEYEAGCYKRT